MGGSSDQLPWLNTGASTREGANQLTQSALGLMNTSESESEHERESERESEGEGKGEGAPTIKIATRTYSTLVTGPISPYPTVVRVIIDMWMHARYTSVLVV